MKTTFTNTTRDDPASIHLSRAVLCLDCEAIYYLGSAVCPVCGSGSGALLAKWMRAMVELPTKTYPPSVLEELSR